jgi:hypothetical protein
VPTGLGAGAAAVRERVLALLLAARVERARHADRLAFAVAELGGDVAVFVVAHFAPVFAVVGKPHRREFAAVFAVDCRQSVLAATDQRDLHLHASARGIIGQIHIEIA